MSEIFEETFTDYSGLGNHESTDALIQAWSDAEKEIGIMKEVEKELRLRVVANVFDPAVTEGTETRELGNGYKLKCSKTISVNVAAADVPALNAALDKIESTDGGKFIVERLVKWSPRVSKSEYQKLDTVNRGIIDDVVTIPPAAVKLEIIEPKAAKAK